MSSDLNGLTTRLVKLIRNTNDLRSRQNLNQRDLTTIKDLDVLIQKLTKMKEKFQEICERLIAAPADVVEAALQDKAMLAVELKSDEQVLAERLRRLNKAVP